MTLKILIALFLFVSANANKTEPYKFEMELDLGTNLEFEGTATFERIEDDESFVVLEVKVEKLFHFIEDGKGKRSEVDVIFSYFDGKLTLWDFQHLEKGPFVFSIGPIGEITFEGGGMLHLSFPENLVTSVFIVEHEMMPITAIDKTPMKFHVQYKNRKITAVKKTEEEICQVNNEGKNFALEKSEPKQF